MDATKNVDDHMISASAFAEGGVQEACDDACSICLEDFSRSDPSTVTNCNHEFHLQCILGWCQRSSNCPMCWRSISLKDASNQTLLEGVVQERIATSYISETPVYHHPVLREFNMQHLHSSDGEIDLEEHIFRHLAAAAAMQRGRHYFPRENQRNRSFSQTSHAYSTNEASNSSHSTDVSSSTSYNGADSESAFFPASRDAPGSVSRNGSPIQMAHRQRMLSESRSFAGQSSVRSQDAAAPSEMQSLADSVRSRLNTWSTRYRESFSRNTRGLKERLFARSSSMADIGSEVQREVNAGINGVSRIIERFDSRGNNGINDDSRASITGSRSNSNGIGSDATYVNDTKMPTSRDTSSASD